MITKFLSERFGDPINHHDNEKLNMQNEPAIATCPNCGMLPINDSCDCEKDCSNCNMPVSQCTCDIDSSTCPACGMMPQAIDEPCTCGFIRESNECNQCGMTEGSCCCEK